MVFVTLIGASIPPKLLRINMEGALTNAGSNMQHLLSVLSASTLTMISLSIISVRYYNFRIKYSKTHNAKQ